jgi:hypothetical protein
MDVTISGNYFSSVTILGIPLFLLTAVLGIITWSLYIALGYLRNIALTSSAFLEPVKNLIYHNRRLNLKHFRRPNYICQYED